MFILHISFRNHWLFLIGAECSLQVLRTAAIKTTRAPAKHNIYGLFLLGDNKIQQLWPRFSKIMDGQMDRLMDGRLDEEKTAFLTLYFHRCWEQIRPLIQSCTIKSYLGEQPWWGAESLGLTQICPCLQMVPR